MDKRTLILLALAVLIIIVIFLVRGKNQMPKTLGGGTARDGEAVLKIGGHQYVLEIADTILKQAKGLSGRPSLADGRGMLFVFATSSMQSFWMHGMQIPLDFIWINGGNVIGVTENVPADSKETYRPPMPAELVVEVNAGTVAKDGIKIGDFVNGEAE